MIAQVIVDISNSEVDRVFDYAIDDFPDAQTTHLAEYLNLPHVDIGAL